MALRLDMRLYVLALGLLLAGCATTSDAPLSKAGIFGKTLAAGECGLYVWTADKAKTFTLFAGPMGVSYLQDKTEIRLVEKNPTTLPAQSRKFADEKGNEINLTLLSPEDIEGGTRYKAGRLTSLADDGWEKVVPIVGLYACQPIV